MPLLPLALTLTIFLFASRPSTLLAAGGQAHPDVQGTAIFSNGLLKKKSQKSYFFLTSMVGQVAWIHPTNYNGSPILPDRGPLVSLGGILGVRVTIFGLKFEQICFFCA